MKTCRAKFYCSHVIPAVEGYDAKAHLHAVYVNSDGTDCLENKSFSDSTPAGNLEIVVSKNVPAHKFFRQGRHYYLDFTIIPLTEQEIANNKAWAKIEKEKKIEMNGLIKEQGKPENQS